MTGARVRIPPSPPRKRDRICGLFFVLHKRRRDEKGTARLWREKNHPVNGFLVPRAGRRPAHLPACGQRRCDRNGERQGGEARRRGLVHSLRQCAHRGGLPHDGSAQDGGYAGLALAAGPIKNEKTRKSGAQPLFRHSSAQHNVLCTRCFWWSFYNRYHQLTRAHKPERLVLGRSCVLVACITSSSTALLGLGSPSKQAL